MHREDTRVGCLTLPRGESQSRFMVWFDFTHLDSRPPDRAQPSSKSLGTWPDGQTFPDQCTPRLSKFLLDGVVSTFGRIFVPTVSPLQPIEMKVT